MSHKKISFPIISVAVSMRQVSALNGHLHMVPLKYQRMNLNVPWFVCLVLSPLMGMIHKSASTSQGTSAIGTPKEFPPEIDAKRHKFEQAMDLMTCKCSYQDLTRSLSD